MLSRSCRPQMLKPFRCPSAHAGAPYPEPKETGNEAERDGAPVLTDGGAGTFVERGS